MITMRSVAALVTVLLTSGLSFGAVITVCQSGCDEVLISDAIQVATNGDTILVYPGLYEEPATVEVNKRLRIVGFGPDSTLIRMTAPPDEAGFVLVVTNEVPAGGVIEISGFSVGGGWAGEIYTFPHPDRCPDLVRVNNCALWGATGSPSGGSSEGYAYRADNCPTELRNSTVTASQHGIWIDDTDHVIVNSAVFGNTSETNGAGIEITETATLTLENVTVSGNTSTSGEGAGIWNRGTAYIQNSTIAFNESSTGYAAGLKSEGMTTISNSIIAENIGNNCGGLPVSQGFNLDSDGSCELNGVGDISGIPSGLSPLADNGGPSPTHGLELWSPALDAIVSNPFPSTDQRLVPRPQDGDGDGSAAADMGAFELIQGLSFYDGFEIGDTSAWSATVP